MSARFKIAFDLGQLFILEFYLAGFRSKVFT